jgi:hypothetical protein
VCLEGAWFLGISRHGAPDTFDVTPKISNPKRCDFYGIFGPGGTSRYSCPTAPEGEAWGERRLCGEKVLLGADEAGAELVVEAGALRLVECGWSICVRGRGRGRVRAVAQNPKTRPSKWVDVDRR